MRNTTTVGAGRGRRAGAMWLVAACASAGVGSSAVAQVTLNAGGGQPIENRQPSLALRIVVQTAGTFGNGVPLRIFAHTAGTAPEWPVADGRTLSQTGNGLLFSQIGTAYGTGSLTTFSLPDLRGRALIGVGFGDAISVVAGELLGSDSVTLTLANLPPHTHTVPGVEFFSPTASSGSGAPFTNVQSSLGVYASIYTTGSFPFSDGFVHVPAAPVQGVIQFHAGRRSNSGARELDGSLLNLNLTQNVQLFSVLGTFFGGNGMTNFAIPDLRGRVLVGTGSSPSTVSAQFGQPLGSNTVNMSLAQMPGHSHGIGGGVFTGFVGTNAAIANEQPSLPVTFCMVVDGFFPGGALPLENQAYLGEIIAFAGNYVPGNMVPCDGRLLLIAEYEALFNCIGTVFGGDGFTTFGVPDLRGRTIIGSSPSLPVGSRVGVSQRTLVASNMPPHAHGLTPRRCSAADVSNTDGDLPGVPDGRIDNGDFSAFFVAFFAPGSSPLRPTADIANTDGETLATGGGPDGAVDNGDFNAFFAAFFVGCPL